MYEDITDEEPEEGELPASPTERELHLAVRSITGTRQSNPVVARYAPMKEVKVAAPPEVPEPKSRTAPAKRSAPTKSDRQRAERIRKILRKVSSLKPKTPQVSPLHPTPTKLPTLRPALIRLHPSPLRAARAIGFPVPVCSVRTPATITAEVPATTTTTTTTPTTTRRDEIRAQHEAQRLTIMYLQRSQEALEAELRLLDE